MVPDFTDKNLVMSYKIGLFHKIGVSKDWPKKIAKIKMRQKIKIYNNLLELIVEFTNKWKLSKVKF